MATRLVRGAIHLQRGRDAESRVDHAAGKRGWRRIARNHHCRGGELDLIYADRDQLIVVEVRYRSRSDYGSAVATVGRDKQRKIIHATRHFLACHPKYAGHAIRFDVVGVDADNNLNWIENAFHAE